MAQIESMVPTVAATAEIRLPIPAPKIVMTARMNAAVTLTGINQATLNDSGSPSSGSLGPEASGGVCDRYGSDDDLSTCLLNCRTFEKIS